MRKFLVILMLVFTNICANAQTVIYGKVTKVSDGDTFTMEAYELFSLPTERVRLQGIDAPEGIGNQPYWQQSRNFLAKLIDKKHVKVSFNGRDKYGRILGTVSVDTIADVNLLMLKEGLAWHYSYYDNTPSYAEAEKAARSKKLGLWADENPVKPYEWRMLKK